MKRSSPKLDAACNRLEAQAKAEAEAARPAHEEKMAAHDARNGKGRKPEPPDDDPTPERQTNLTDPDSTLMRKSEAHECRQAYNAQAVVCADGAQLILAVNVATTPTDQPTFAEIILSIEQTIGLPKTVLADAGFASAAAVKALQDRTIEPLVAIAKTQPHRPYDFRPPPDPKPERQITEPWRIEMKAKLETDDAKTLCKRRKQTVEPVFGIVNSAIGFRSFLLRGLEKGKNEWTLVSLAYNCRRTVTLMAA